jgi:hypothetical protein
MGFVGAGTAAAAAPVSHPNAQSAGVGHAPAKPNCKVDKTNPACVAKHGKKKP